MDPEGKRGVGDVVCLGDAVLLVDDRGFVWSYSVSTDPLCPKLVYVFGAGGIGGRGTVSILSK